MTVHIYTDFSQCHTVNYTFSLLVDDTTGIHSIYTVYQGHELMFHVSTMLPYSKENKQQVSLITMITTVLSI